MSNRAHYQGAKKTTGITYDRGEYLCKMAWWYILDRGISMLPVDAVSLAKKDGYIILTYTEYAELIYKGVDYVKKKYAETGFAFWSDNRECFVICYNSEMTHGIILWTIMHEIGHIVLGHIAPKKEAVPRIRQLERPQIEREADGFARRVLCPSIVLHDCGAIEENQIIKLCGVGKLAAYHRSRYMKVLEARNMWCVDPMEQLVREQFRLFAESWTEKALSPDAVQW